MNLQPPERILRAFRMRNRWPAPVSNSIKTGARRSEAFTRVEWVAVLSALALLALVAFPVLASSQSRGEQLNCVSNLRQIGQAFARWANDHGEMNPWQVSYLDGGSFPTDENHQAPWQELVGNAWFQFSWISNELASPRVLACPSDSSIRVATEWSTSLAGGLLNPGYRNNAISYLISLHSFREDSQSLLCADRNIIPGQGSIYCKIGGNNARAIYRQDNNGWNRQIHGYKGNYLSQNGTVVQLSNAELNQALDSWDHYPAIHVLGLR